MDIPEDLFKEIGTSFNGNDVLFSQLIDPGLEELLG
jgi:hypothetical protein